MGYVPGKGLGRHETGIAEPISEASNKGRLGLGYFLKGLESEDVRWELEEVSVLCGGIAYILVHHFPLGQSALDTMCMEQDWKPLMHFHRPNTFGLETIPVFVSTSLRLVYTLP